MNAYAAVADFSVNWEHSAPSNVSQESSAGRTPELPSAQEVVRERNGLLLSALAKAFEEAISEGCSISGGAVKDLPSLLPLIPSALPPAEASILASGSISFDWDRDPENQLSVILIGGNRIGFAACFEGDRIYGTVQMGDRLPDEVAAAATKWLRRNRILDYEFA